MYIKIHVQTDASGNLISYSADKIVSLVRQVCNGYSAVYDENTNRCDILGIDGIVTCPNGQALKSLTISLDSDGARRYVEECTPVNP